ncbi:hypothetical protein VTK26DRAFT_9498 [Humicola hyalothermophila]
MEANFHRGSWSPDIPDHHSHSHFSGSYSPSPERPDAIYFPHQPKSLAGIATRAFCLGITLAVGLIGTAATLLFTDSPLWRLPFFLAALSAFHFLEFWTTAAYNTRAAEVSSFLLTSNWPGYAIAHTVAALECAFTNLVWPGRPFTSAAIFTFPNSAVSALTLAGVVLTLLGQAVRTAAMAHAGQSFNHQVQQRRSSDHVLVTTGVYGLLRHPSYFGFFWWALGTQLVMGNALSLAGFALVLWRFFRGRIRHEEELLVIFFGDAYVQYRRRVGVWIPFVR